MPNPAAARAAAIAAGARSSGDGLCSGDHLEGCVVRGPGGLAVKMLRDSSVPKGKGRLCRCSAMLGVFNPLHAHKSILTSADLQKTCLCTGKEGHMYMQGCFNLLQ